MARGRAASRSRDPSDEIHGAENTRITEVYHDSHHSSQNVMSEESDLASEGETIGPRERDSPLPRRSKESLNSEKRLRSGSRTSSYDGLSDGGQEGDFHDSSNIISANDGDVDHISRQRTLRKPSPGSSSSEEREEVSPPPRSQPRASRGRSQVVNLRRQVTQLENESEEKDRIIDELRKRLRKLEDEIASEAFKSGANVEASMEAVFKVRERELEAAEDDKHALSQTVRQLRRDKRVLENDYHELTIALESHEKTNTEVKRRLWKLQSEKKEVEDEVVRLRPIAEQVHALEAALERERVQHEQASRAREQDFKYELDEKVNTITAARDSLSTTVERISEENEQLRHRLKEIEADCQLLRRDRKEVEGALVKLHESGETTTAQYAKERAESEAALQQMREQREAIAAQLEIARQDRDRVLAAIETQQRARRQNQQTRYSQTSKDQEATADATTETEYDFLAANSIADLDKFEFERFIKNWYGGLLEQLRRVMKRVESQLLQHQIADPGAAFVVQRELQRSERELQKLRRKISTGAEHLPVPSEESTSAGSSESYDSDAHCQSADPQCNPGSRSRRSVLDAILRELSNGHETGLSQQNRQGQRPHRKNRPASRRREHARLRNNERASDEQKIFAKDHDILRRARILLGVHSFDLIIPALERVSQALGSVPRLEKFAREVSAIATGGNEKDGLYAACEDAAAAVSTLRLGGKAFGRGRASLESVMRRLRRMQKRSVSWKALRRGLESTLNARDKTLVPPRWSTESILRAVSELVEHEKSLGFVASTLRSCDVDIRARPDVTVNRIVQLLQRLFHVEAVERLVPVLHKVHLEHSELKVFVKVLRDLLGLEDGAPPSDIVANVRSLLVSKLTSEKGFLSPAADPADLRFSESGKHGS